MMILTERQKDSLVELINIAFGRAASSLSSLTGKRVVLSSPRISLHPMSQLEDVFVELKQSEVATVHQIFSGSVAGNALLVLDYEGARALSRMMAENRAAGDRLDETDYEVLTEIGNILLNACLGTFGNILHVHISFSVPRIQVDALNALLDSLTIGSEELQYALVVFTDFRLRDSAVGGYLLMVLGVSSLDSLIQAIDKLG